MEACHREGYIVYDKDVLQPAKFEKLKGFFEGLVRLIVAAFALQGVFAADAAPAQEADAISLTNHPSFLYPWSNNYSAMMTLKPYLHWGGKQFSLTIGLDDLLSWTRQLDNLTRGVPKLFAVTGEQLGGHDAQYPCLESWTRRSSARRMQRWETRWIGTFVRRESCIA